MAPTPLSFKTRGGGGGWGVLHTRTGPGRPPPPRGWKLGALKLAGCKQAQAQALLETGGGVTGKKLNKNRPKK